MGLALEVGILADLRENDEEGFQSYKDQFAALNRHLEQAHIKTHVEPEDCEVWSCDMFGYSGLHYLRRLAAYLDSTSQLPQPGDADSSNDPVLQQYYRTVSGTKPSLMSRLFSRQQSFKRGFDHLIFHGDAEGFYLPIDFDAVLFPEDIAGQMVGSSRRLLSECERIATVLEIPSGLDEASDALWEAADSQGEGTTTWERYGIESFSCVCLMQACKKSIESGAAIVFC